LNLAAPLILGLALAPAALIADPAPGFTPIMDDLLDQLDALAMFNGTVLIDRGGEVIYRREVGQADYGLEVPIGPRTRYRIASLSKMYTDAAVASLVEKGDLSLDKTIDEWLPGFPGADQIQIRQILEHRSGIPHTNAQPWGDGNVVLDLDEIVHRLSELPLDFEPGANRSYSNGGYAVLIYLLEKVTGLAWPELIAREVLRPLDLDDTGVVVDSRAVIRHMANGYEPGPTYASRRESRFYAVEMRPGGGDLFATAGDVHRFFSETWRGNFAGATGQAMFRANQDTRTMSGRSPGFNTAVLYEPAEDLLVISLANNYAADFNWAESLAAIVLGRKEFIQDAPELAAAPWRADDRMVGPWRYEIERFSQALRIGHNADGSLYVNDDESQTRTALLPLAGGGYLETLYFGRCEWNGGSQDRIHCTRWYPEGFVADLIR
jgi:CubicO group peptidase (beta-lactamase class C family)